MTSRRHQPRKYWEDTLQTWSLSRQSARCWCREHKIKYSTFLNWKNRLALPVPPEGQDTSVQKLPSSTQVDFVELADSPVTKPGISLECAGVIIHLTNSFDPHVLRQCLDIVRGGTC